MINPGHNYERIPETACLVPEYILLTYLDTGQLEEHIQFRYKQQTEAIDAFNAKKGNVDQEFEKVNETAHNYVLGIREENNRRKASKRAHPAMYILKTDLL